MFKETTFKDTTEIKNNDAKDYKEIKPEGTMDKSDVKAYWDKVFSGENSEHIDIKNDDKVEKDDVKVKVDVKEDVVEGGSYREVKPHSDGSIQEVHHMPADEASPLYFKDGPAIRMEKEDHRKTASWGSSLEARQYRAEQAEKIKNGDFRGAVQMDIDDIKEKFPDKYDKAIEQMMKYVDKLEAEGKIECK